MPRPKAPSKEALAAELKHEREQAYLWREAYRGSRRGTPLVGIEEWFEEGGPRYTVELYDVHRAHGGYVIVRFAYPGQLDSFDVYYLDWWVPPTLEARIAKERLTIARSKELAKEVPSA